MFVPNSFFAIRQKCLRDKTLRINIKFFARFSLFFFAFRLTCCVTLSFLLFLKNAVEYFSKDREELGAENNSNEISYGKTGNEFKVEVIPLQLFAKRTGLVFRGCEKQKRNKRTNTQRKRKNL